MLRLIHQDIHHRSKTEETSQFVSRIDPSMAVEKMSVLMSECIYPGCIKSLYPRSLTSHPYAKQVLDHRVGGGQRVRVTIWLSIRHFICTALEFEQMVAFHLVVREEEHVEEYAEGVMPWPGHLAKSTIDNNTISGQSPNLLLSEYYPLSVVRRHWFFVSMPPELLRVTARCGM